MSRLLSLPAALTTLLFLATAAAAGILLDRIVAVVDEDVITWSELYKTMEFELSDRLAGLSPEDKRRRLKGLEREYLERLIDLKVQLHEARRLQIGATEEEVDYALAQIRRKHGLTEETFLEALRKEGLALEEYREMIAEQIIISKLVDLEVRSKLILPEEEIERYARQKGEELDLSEGYRIRQIFFPAATPRERKEAEEKAREVIELLKSGEPFESLARRYSKGPNASNGGDLGFIRKKDLAGEFLALVEEMEVGEYRGPFQTDKGIHIIKLEGRSGTGPEVSAKERAGRLLLKEKFREALNDWLRSLRSRAHIEIKL